MWRRGACTVAASTGLACREFSIGGPGASCRDQSSALIRPSRIANRTSDAKSVTPSRAMTRLR